MCLIHTVNEVWKNPNSDDLLLWQNKLVKKKLSKIKGHEVKRDRFLDELTWNKFKTRRF